eukprot:1147926-Pelagomonas_calceolata.AAC.1
MVIAVDGIASSSEWRARKVELLSLVVNFIKFSPPCAGMYQHQAYQPNSVAAVTDRADHLAQAVALRPPKTLSAELFLDLPKQ